MYIANTIYKSRHAANVISLSTIVAAIFALVACDLPQSLTPAEEGVLSITIAPSGTMSGLSLLPDTSMEPAEYRITGSGPSDDSFETTSEGGTVDVYGLRTGEWDVEVFALNAQNEEIGYGVDQVSVEAGAVSDMEIIVRALTGTGTLSLSVAWPEAEVSDPSIEAALVDTDGEQTALSFASYENGSADYHGEEVDAGYYTLTVELYDGEDSVAGAVETVRIVEGGVTEGVFDFEDLNYPTGSIDIIIVPDLDEPLEVSISGAVATLTHGDSMTVEASVSNADGTDISYTWYLNGSTIGSGSVLTLGADLDPGAYRLDVVAMTADGSRSGSTTHDFSVE